jgi:hypothetical protein
MKTFPHPIMMWVLFVILASCTGTPKSPESMKFIETTVPIQAIQPTQVAIPVELAFATPLVQVLRQSGLSILSVQDSVYMAMFQSTDNAAWIKTDKGIVNAVFFDEPTEAKSIHIFQDPNEITGRYLYTIQAPQPTLLHEQTIDAAFPLFFTMESGMLMVTSSADLDTILKRIFSEQ